MPGASQLRPPISGAVQLTVSALGLEWHAAVEGALVTLTCSVIKSESRKI